jgi:hypothetical protein
MGSLQSSYVARVIRLPRNSQGQSIGCRSKQAPGGSANQPAKQLRPDSAMGTCPELFRDRFEAFRRAMHQPLALNVGAAGVVKSSPKARRARFMGNLVAMNWCVIGVVNLALGADPRIASNDPYGRIHAGRWRVER